MKHIFHRLELLTGKTAFERLRDSRVIIFGVGGVGSWCAEGLIRSGIGHLAIVDSDNVCVTNINRQIEATVETVGKAKVDVLKERLLSINPNASIDAICRYYNRQTEPEFDLTPYQYCVDAIDSLCNKVGLIVHAHNCGCKVYSALGAACKLDVTRIRLDSIWNSQGCHLGRFVRKRLRKRGFSGEVTCVYSDELIPNLGQYTDPCISGNCCNKTAPDHIIEHELPDFKKQINGSSVTITATFGMFLAGAIVKDIVGTTTEIEQPAEEESIEG